jgi:hypothetical protein
MLEQPDAVVCVDLLGGRAGPTVLSLGKDRLDVRLPFLFFLKTRHVPAVEFQLTAWGERGVQGGGGEGSARVGEGVGGGGADFRAQRI